MRTEDAEQPLSIRCPAKLNLTLAVGAPRADGLHPIASIMVALDFGDDLLLRRLEVGPSTFDRRFADDAPKPQPIDWPIEADLIYRAHARLQELVGKELPVACEVVKRIPAGAGLGGGSSNAAAMLVGLNQLFGPAIDENALLDLAQKLGADVAFLIRALLGKPAALASGTGSDTSPLRNIPPFDCVLAFPEGQCPTPAVYRAFDQLNPAASIPQGLLQSWERQQSVPEPYNDLLDAAASVCPRITQVMQTVTAQGLVPRLTGSGSAVFAIVESQQQAIAIAETFTHHGLAARPARYCPLP